MRRALAWFAARALAAALLIGEAAAGDAPRLADLEDARALEEAIEAAARDVAPCIVEILIERGGRDEGDGAEPDPLRQILARVDPDALPRGDGAIPGVIVGEDGLVVTALHHVDEAPRKVHARLIDGSVVEAEIVARDDRIRLAALRLPRGRYPVARLAPARSVRVGEIAIAVGVPEGAPLPAVRFGIVSALERRGGLMLQTDAPIDPSNSGGALVDIRGNVIGIPVLLTRQTGVNSGVGFAVKADVLRAALPRLRAGESVRAGFLGVILASDEDDGEGAVVETVIDDTPAARAGLAVGDVIEAIDGERLDGAAALRDELGARAEGTSVVLSVRRKGKLVALRAVLGAAPPE